MSAVVEITFILVLVLLNGVFAMSELAVVSSRRARLQEHANQGSTGARVALELSEQPDQFLSTVQVGITLVGVLAGAFGGATLASLLSEQFAQVSFLAPQRDALAFGVVVALITYLSLIFGELVPKRIALRNPERIAALIAPAMRTLSKLAYPVVRFLSLSTQLVARLLGVEEDESQPVTEEEIRIMLDEGTQAGVFEADEQDMVESIFTLNDRPISVLMTPHTEVVWLDIDDTLAEVRQKLTGSEHSCLLVCEGGLDKIRGVVHAQKLLTVCLAGEPLGLTDHMRKPIFVPENAPASRAVELLRQSEDHMIFAVGEHGGVEGIVTDHDVLEAIVGDIPSLGEIDDPDVVYRADGSMLIDGMTPMDEIQTLLDLEALPEETGKSYNTLAGFIMALLGHIPITGEIACWEQFRFEVVDMDERRIDKVLVQAREV